MFFTILLYCIASPSYCQTHCDYAHNLLCLFVNNFCELYGRDMLVYNVHGLVYLAISEWSLQATVKLLSD